MPTTTGPTAEQLLSRGYFPAELPPSFQTRDFAARRSGIPAPPRNEWTKATGLALARPGGIRRNLAIPNPFNQATISDLVAQEWSELYTSIARSKISISRPLLDQTGRRALKWRRSFSELPYERIRRMNTARYVLRTDVAQFYPSVYTHSIEWALIGKAAAKSRIKAKRPRNGQMPLGAQLDAAVREGQDGQTKGIPIGPDTSLVIAELILCDIDRQIQSKIPRLDQSSLRFMDDLEFYTNSRSSAEDVLVLWQSLLASYELNINPEKTQILDLPQPIDKPWHRILAQSQIRGDSDIKLSNDIVSLFSAAFELSPKYPADQVLGYAISRLREATLGPKSWNVMTRFLLSSMVTEPSCMIFACAALTKGAEQGFRIPKQRLEETLNEIALHHAKLYHGSEVVWALWMLARFRLSLEEAGAKAVSKMSDNCSLILLLSLAEYGQIKGSNTSFGGVIKRAEMPNVWATEDWLLGYEAAAHGWCSPASVEADPAWKALLDSGVHFFKWPGVVRRRPQRATATGAAPSPSVTPQTSKQTAGTTFDSSIERILFDILGAPADDSLDVGQPSAQRSEDMTRDRAPVEENIDGESRRLIRGRSKGSQQASPDGVTYTDEAEADEYDSFVPDFDYM